MKFFRAFRGQNIIMQWLHFQPLKTKLLWIIMLVVFTTVTTTLVFLYWQKNQQQRDNFIRTNMGLAKLVAEYTILPLVFNDLDGANDILAKLQKDPRIAYLRLERLDGGILTAYDPTHAADIAPQLKNGQEWLWRDGYLYFMLPINHNQTNLGILKGAYRLNELIMMQRQEQRFMVVVMIIAALCSYVLALILRNFVMTPIKQLERHARSIADQPIGSHETIDSPLKNNDELSHLYDAFNFLMARIQQREAEILQLNRELEIRIQQRTQDLEDSRRILALSLKASKQWLWDWDISGGILHLDVELMRLCTFMPPSTVTIDWLNERIHADDQARVQQLRQDLLQGRQAHCSVEFRIRTANNDFHWLLSQGQVIEFDSTGNPVRIIGTHTDITQKKNSALMLAKAKDAADQANRAKSEFLANMSHEIRTPMNAIINFSHLALNTGLNPKQHDYVLKTHTAATGLLSIINDILDFSKIEAGKLIVEQTPFDLADVINNAMSIGNALATEKNLDIRFLVNPCLPMRVCGDPLRLGQVMLNLINNAVKFTEQGQVSVAIRQGFNDGRHLELLVEVQDTGIGIEPEHFANLFQSFNQIDPSVTRRFGGTGLGLAISKQLVELMGGRITVSSQPHVGSVFRFSVLLGLQHTDQPEPSNLAQPVDTECDTCSVDHCTSKLSSQLSGLKTLIISEDNSDAALLASRCALWGIPTTPIETLDAALELLQQADVAAQPFELLIVNDQALAPDALTAIDSIRQQACSKHLPIVVMMSAANQGAMRLQRTSQQPLSLLVKPFSNSALFNAISAHVVPMDVKPSAPPNKDPIYPGLYGAQILLAEDNKINQQIAAELLANVGINLHIAENGRVAVAQALAHGQNYAAILMDVQMPEMDGLEATRRIREHLPDIPIIAMTAYALVQEKQRCYRAGMNDHIEKPVDPILLYATLARWIKPTKPSLPSVVCVHDNNITAGNDVNTLPEQLPPFDIPAALLRINGKKTLLHKLMLEFYRQYRTLPTDLLYAPQEDAQRQIHTLRSTAAMLGLAKVATEAKQLEMELSTLPLAACTNQFNNLCAALAPALEIAGTLPALPGKPATPVESANIQQSTELIDELRRLLTNHNLRARKCLAELQVGLPKNDKLAEMVDTLAEQTGQLDFDGAQITLNALEKTLIEQDKIS